MPVDEPDLSTPGWHAIDAALRPLYGDQQPKHYGSVISYALGGKDPLQGISAYARQTPVPHWHFITYGFSELYAKESEDETVSGWGFELTFRLCASAFEEEPPAWAINFLQNLARYVFQTGRVFESGDYMNLNGPIAVEEATAIRSIAFVPDPELPAIDTPNGHLQFIQVVGLTNDEEIALKQWSTLKVMETLLPHLPLYSTDLARQSLLTDPAIHRQILDGAQREGSNTGYILVDQLDYVYHADAENGSAVLIVLGAKQVNELLAILPNRLRFGNAFGLVGNGKRIWIKPGENCEFAEGEDGLSAHITQQVMQEIGEVLKARQGVYTFPAWEGVLIEVRPTFIRDAAGEVVEVIGG